MRRFIQFNDKKIDSLLFMQLSDLAKTLTRENDIEVEFGYRSYVDLVDRKLYVSHFWDNHPLLEKTAGLKTDIYLRAIGSFHHTNFHDVFSLIEKAKRTNIPGFAKQLFMLMEDLRLEDICKRERPGTKKPFRMRRDIYRRYFQSQLNVNRIKGVHTDALFNICYLLLTSDSPLEEVPPIEERIDLAMPFIRQLLPKCYDAKSSSDVSNVVVEFIEVLDEILDRDMLNTYFHLPEKGYSNQVNSSFQNEKRTNPLENGDILLEDKKGDEDIHNEILPTWHRETSDMTKSFLQFDLEHGAGTSLFGDAAREGEDGDQVLAIIQGSAQSSFRNDYAKLEAIEEKRDARTSGTNGAYGKENQYAVPIFLPINPPSVELREAYQRNREKIEAYQKKLKQMIEKTLEHKKVLPRSDLHAGRLNKKLLRYFTDDNPRLFYKKQERSKQIDAVFTLIVDCSASMIDKMEQTKLGIILFHEALKSLLVPHQVIGFWEDTNEASETKQPNYFKIAVSFDNCFKKKTGPEIMQLEPEEDNRDGFAIRVITEELLKRTEKQKFLLVFSDGEPAAFGYEQNGIIDTHEAVVNARKKGIEVINVFLANGEVEEGQRKMVQNIYGKYSILIPDVSELPDVLFPLLRKLLIKSL